MFRFRSLSIAAAILFLIAGGTAYGGSVKPQPLGVIAPPSDTVLARGARSGGRSFAARGYRGGAVGVRGPRGGGAVAARGRYGGRGYAVRGPHGGGRAVGVRGGRAVHGVRGPRGGAVAVGTRYRGGVWYGPVRRHWRGRWWAYGVGSCWRWTDIGYVWICN
jgi:hypothetical protein